MASFFGAGPESGRIEWLLSCPPVRRLGESMVDPRTLDVVLAHIDKHHIAGIVAIVVGALLAIVGGIRFLTRATRAALAPVAGLVILVLGILVYVRAI
jgi:hypothetical protein